MHRLSFGSVVYYICGCTTHSRWVRSQWISSNYFCIVWIFSITKHWVQAANLNFYQNCFVIFVLLGCAKADVCAWGLSWLPELYDKPNDSAIFHTDDPMVTSYYYHWSSTLYYIFDAGVCFLNVDKMISGWNELITPSWYSLAWNSQPNGFAIHGSGVFTMICIDGRQPDTTIEAS